MPSSDRYTLFSDTSKPCAFFFSDKGCRNGDKCKWRHTKEEVPPACQSVTADGKKGGKRVKAAPAPSPKGAATAGGAATKKRARPETTQQKSSPPARRKGSKEGAKKGGSSKVAKQLESEESESESESEEEDGAASPSPSSSSSKPFSSTCALNNSIS